jgi:hypothetical protein
VSRGKLAKLYYMEIKQLLDRKVIQNKRGTLTNREIKLLVQEIHNCQQGGGLQQGTVETKIRAMQKKIQCYNVKQLGEILTKSEGRTMRILVCQMGGSASVKTREIKIAAMERLICKYNINLFLFMELNFNWSKINSSSNLASWFMDKEREMTRCVTAHNVEENNELFGKHQPDRTGMLCQHEYLQYARKPMVDKRPSWEMVLLAILL